MYAMSMARFGFELHTGSDWVLQGKLSAPAALDCPVTGFQVMFCQHSMVLAAMSLIVMPGCRPHQQELRAWAENLVLGQPPAEELDKKV